MSTTQPEDARKLYDRLAPLYGPAAGWWERRARTAGLDCLAAGPGEHVLEVGCGPGAALVPLARAAGPEGRVVGVDVSPAMCKAARRAVARAIPDLPVEVREADAAHLPYPDTAFDACFMAFTLELFGPGGRPAVLAECRRVLRPGGRLVVVGLSADGPDTVMRRAYWRGHNRFPWLLDCRPIHIAADLRTAGFDQVTADRLRMWGLPVEVAAGLTPAARTES